MTTINTEAFKKAGFNFEEIESIRQGIEELDNGLFLTEQEVFGKLEKTIKSNVLLNV